MSSSAAFWSASGGLFQRVGATMGNGLTPECFVFSPNPERHLVYTGKRSRQKETACTGKQVPVDAAAQCHARTGESEGLVREMILHSIR